MKSPSCNAARPAPPIGDSRPPLRNAYSRLARLFVLAAVGLSSTAIGCSSAGSERADGTPSADGGAKPGSSDGGTSPGAEVDKLEPLPPGTAYTPFGNQGIAAIDQDLAATLSSVVEDDRGRLLTTSGFKVTRLSKTGVVETQYANKTPELASGPNASVRIHYGSLGASGSGQVIFAGAYSRIGSEEGGSKVAAMRLTDAGDVDTAFGNAGVAEADFGVTLDPQTVRFAMGSGGAFAIAANVKSNTGSTTLYAARFGNDGSVEGTYAVELGDHAEFGSVAMQADGKILIGGELGEFNRKSVVVRLTKSGTLDTSFGQGGIASLGGAQARGVRSIAIRNDGAIFAAFRSNDSSLLAKLSPDGKLDSSFGAAGVTTFADYDAGLYAWTLDIVAQESGHVVAIATAEDGDKRDIVASRVDAAGNLDIGYGQNGLARPFAAPPAKTFARAVTVMRSGLIIVAGFRVDDPEADDVKEYGALFAISP